MDNVLSQIRSTEEKAEKNVENARKNADEVIAKARSDSFDLSETAEKEVESIRKKEFDRALKEAEKQKAQLSEESEKRLKTLKAGTLKKKPEGVDLVLKVFENEVLK